MKHAIVAALAALGLAACGQSGSQSDAEPTGKPMAPEVVENLPSLADLGDSWRLVDPENLILIRTPHGETAIELNPDFAPVHAQRMREIATAGAMNGQHFYRVIDGFVAQGGMNEDINEMRWPTLANENERDIDPDAGFEPLGNGDLYAPTVGHIGGFPVARNSQTGKEWLLHCPGAMAMARDVDPDSGGTEFYITLDAQRYLDRNLTVFGRVVSGMQYLQKLKRGDPKVESGVIQSPDTGDKILSFKLASTIPEEKRPWFAVMKTDSLGFARLKSGKRKRDGDFFYNTPPEVVDICDAQAPAERVSAPE